MSRQRLISAQGYMKAVKAELQKSNPDQVEKFEKNAAAYAKKIVANFKDYEFVRRCLLCLTTCSIRQSTPART